MIKETGVRASDAERLAVGVLDRMADRKVIKRAAAAVVAGTHLWIFDPDVPDVVGLVAAERADRPAAVVVVYLDPEDFEADERWVYGS